MSLTNGFEVHEICATYSIYIDDANVPKDLQIQIIKIDENTYSALCNYDLKTDKQIAPYQSNVLRKTKEDALSAILSGFEFHLRGASNISWVSVKK